eukprot:GFKZ01003423.1.p1 GENE.GFKZ01003423.1~~GFKZ01003423.1.p1  ORF type:complete len:259 (-),score=49.44 GFKZ01003423.1:513-1214(-)
MSPSAIDTPPTETLSSQLLAKQKGFLSSIPADAAAAIASTSENFAKNFTPTPPALHAAAPDFSLPNATNKTVSLSSLLSTHSAVVLTWYRGGWCPYCNLTLRALALAVPELEKVNARLVCLTPETPDESLSVKEKLELPFEVLSDDGVEVADKYGVMFQVPDDIKTLYKSFGFDLDGTNGNAEKSRMARLPLPATFVIGKSGKVEWSFVDVDYTKRAEPADVIAAVKKVVESQ